MFASLDEIKQKYEKNAVFIITRSVNQNTVVHAFRDGQWDLFWLDIDPAFIREGKPIRDEFTLLDHRVFGLTWLNSSQARFNKQLDQRTVTFSPEHKVCWVEIQGRQMRLQKIHAELHDNSFLGISSIKHVVLTGLDQQGVLHHEIIVR